MINPHIFKYIDLIVSALLLEHLVKLQLRLSLREDQAEVIHAISPFSMKLCQVEGTTQ